MTIKMTNVKEKVNKSQLVCLKSELNINRNLNFLDGDPGYPVRTAQRAHAEAAADAGGGHLVHHLGFRRLRGHGTGNLFTGLHALLVADSPLPRLDDPARQRRGEKGRQTVEVRAFDGLVAVLKGLFPIETGEAGGRQVGSL